jgi:hypothetical protein
VRVVPGYRPEASDVPWYRLPFRGLKHYRPRLFLRRNHDFDDIFSRILIFQAQFDIRKVGTFKDARRFCTPPLGGLNSRKLLEFWEVEVVFPLEPSLEHPR